MRTLTKVFCIAVLIGINITAQADEIDLAKKFSQHTVDSSATIDFSAVDEMLHAGVINMGYSTRSFAQRAEENFGTRMRRFVDKATDNEANRFFYESLSKKQIEIELLKQALIQVSSDTPLHLYSKDEQLAYWLNLYNVTLINEIAKFYPKDNLKSHLYGAQSFLEEKLLTINGIRLSLNDIQYEILQKNYDNNPLLIYGLYQGNIGGPNIRQKAYTGKSVYKSLSDNAFEFINSNRGTQFNGKEDEVRVSKFYTRNKSFFPDFHDDLKQHLLTYAKYTISGNIEDAKRFNPNIKNWKIADLYGSQRNYSGSVGTKSALHMVEDNMIAKNSRLLELMRIRAINFGGGSVTVTDIETDDEDELPEINDN